MNRNFISLDLSPRGNTFEGKRLHPSFYSQGIRVDHLCLAPGDAELLISVFAQSPGRYEQEAARSVSAALREWREAIIAEDKDLAGTPYDDHVESTHTPSPTDAGAAARTANYE